MRKALKISEDSIEVVAEEIDWSITSVQRMHDMAAGLDNSLYVVVGSADKTTRWFTEKEFNQNFTWVERECVTTFVNVYKKTD